MGSIPSTTNFNPIGNQRFFVWQHYGDFEDSQPEPDESGLDYWTSQITSTCSTGFNDNDSCTDGKRIDVFLAFWVDQYASWFTTSYGLPQIQRRQTPPTHDSSSSATSGIYVEL